MIQPTIRTVLLLLASALGMLAIAVSAPQSWALGFAVLIFVALAMASDFVLAIPARALRFDVRVPPQLYVGRDDVAEIAVAASAGRGTAHAALTLDLEGPLAPADIAAIDLRSGATTTSALLLTPTRRGKGAVRSIALRWHGPLGLIRRTLHHAIDREVPILSDIKSVHETAILLDLRDAPFGQKMQRQRGEGSEFDALREYGPGLDHRSIDWKHSARHMKLLSKEFRTERNHPVVLAFDSGQLMAEPLGGIARIDHAINAGLLLAFTALRGGDRVGLYSFDARPRLLVAGEGGVGRFPALQRACADIDYARVETNYTLGLSHLAGRLKRRTLIVLFTEFVDTTTARLMMETIGRLTRTHVVMFVTFRDAALRTTADAMPDDAGAVARSVVAHDMLDERHRVQQQLKRFGVFCVETAPDRIGAAIVNQYLEIKQRELVG